MLAEKQSEHPLAKAIVKKIQSLIPSHIDEFNQRYKIIEFKNKDGEGVTAVVEDVKCLTENPLQGQPTYYQIACGNDKLMKSQNVDFSGVSTLFNSFSDG